VQNEQGNEAQGLCKHEFQEFMIHAVHPLLVKDVQDRLKKNVQYTVSGKPLAEVVEEWRGMLRGAYEGLKEGLWRGRQGADIDAYKFDDDATPYFLTLDNCPSYSFLGPGGKVHNIELDKRFLFCLLQIYHMPPHGHDLHQLVEHAIGVIKRAVQKWLNNLSQNLATVSHAEVQAQLNEAAKSYDNLSWRKNVHRLFVCMKIVAADVNEFVQPTELKLEEGELVVHSKGRKQRGTAGGYPYSQVS
jgi:hypothetical protein